MTLQTIDAEPRRRAARLVDRLAGAIEDRTSRRGFFARVAVVGSALAVGPGQFLLRPGTAYGAVCGADSSCSSGYTVFCATIQNGLNRCPPNSLVGGWWKADNSGFCCGSARYYIDCHSYCSCGCGGGSRFCGEGCRSCSCGCGPDGQCDQRRVCCNNFRYGQCMQHVSCTGPVWCRVVTCTPPWRVEAWRCTTTSATDNRTGSHTSPTLPSCSPVDQKYTALGGQAGVLGEPVSAELRTPDGLGQYNHYDGGSVYASQGSGAHMVRGPIRAVWESRRWEAGPLGYPITDELTAPDGVGRYNHFSKGGSIYWSPATGAHVVWGSVRAVWESLRWEAGPLGYPITDELTAPDGAGRYNHFSKGGSIYWSPSTGAHAVWGNIRATWEQLGWETGPLGYPTTSESQTPDGIGRYNHFSKGGSIYWTQATGANAVLGPIRHKWESLRWEAGPLGYPLISQRTTPDGVGRYNHFSRNASIYWTPDTGAHVVWGGIRARWESLRWESGPLGYPVTDEQAAPGGRGTFNDFVGPGTPSGPAGSIYWSPQTGAVSVLGPIRTAWLENGGPAGALGFPTAEPRGDGPGRTRSDFEGGYVVHDQATGRTIITLT